MIMAQKIIGKEISIYSYINTAIFCPHFLSNLHVEIDLIQNVTTYPDACHDTEGSDGKHPSTGTVRPLREDLKLLY